MIKPISFIVAAILSLMTLYGLSCDDSAPISPSPKSASVLWSIPNPKDGVLFGGKTQPIIEGNLVYAIPDTALWCINLTTGELVWSVGIDTILIKCRAFVLSQNAIYIGDGSRVYAFNKSNGERLWKTVVPDFTSSIFNYLVENETHLFFGGRESQVVRLQKATGQVDMRIALRQWVPSGLEQIAYDIKLSDDGDMLYVPLGSWDGMNLRGDVLCFNARTGQFRWRYEARWSVESCDIQDSVLVFPAGQYMTALNRFTGQKIWETFVPDNSFWATPKIHRNLVYMGGVAEGAMYAFDLRTGEKRWVTDANASVITIISVRNGMVFFTNGVEIHVLEAETGRRIWFGAPPEYRRNRSYIYSSPVAVNDDYIVCSGSRKVYCLTVPK
ncbi:MAG: PQQ-binding-like beta-propeller repeat protein [Chloroherpetonaceae bacterium]